MLTAIILTLSASVLRAQYYVIAGYNANCPLKMDNLNLVVDYYNWEHPNLQETMEHFYYMDGFTCAIGTAYEPLFAEIGYTGATQTVSSGMYDSGFWVEKQLRARLRTFDINIGICTGLKEYNYFAAGIGMNVGVFSVKTKTKADYINNDKWSGNLAKNESGVMTFTFFLRYSPYGGYIWLQPYISIAPNKFLGFDMNRNMHPVDQYLNPTTVPTHQQDLNITFKSTGVKMCILIPYYDNQ